MGKFKKRHLGQEHRQFALTFLKLTQNEKMKEMYERANDVIQLLNTYRS